MSKFTTPAKLEMLDDYLWKVLEDFSFYREGDTEEVITVPAGFISDLATVPRIFWTFFPPHGKYAKAAIIHDYLYENAINTKRYADDVFIEACKVLGVSGWRIFFLKWSVRLFGRGNYPRESFLKR